MLFKLIFSFIIISLFGVLYCSSVSALSLSSERIIFDKENNKKKLTIVNNTDKEQRYSIELVHYTMFGEKGFLKKIPKNKNIKNVNWADNLVAIDPTEIIIPAFSSKKIILSIINSKEKKYGEYRTHLWVRSNKKLNKTNKNSSVIITTYSGVSKPIFIRYGDFKATVKIKNVIIHHKNKGKDNEYKVGFTLTRIGNRSVYGSIEIACRNKEKTILLKKIGGIALYTEVNKKLVSFNFKIPNNIKDNCNNINLLYRAIDTDNYFVNKIMARTSIRFFNKN